MKCVPITFAEMCLSNILKEWSKKPIDSKPTLVQVVVWYHQATSQHLIHMVIRGHSINTLRPGQNGRHFPDDFFKCIFLNENTWISIDISLKFVPKGRINNIPALAQIMTWRRLGDKPLSEPMMVGLLTHICVTRPQWVILWCHMATQILVNIGPGIGLLPDNSNPLPDPMLTNHQCGPMTITWPKFHKKGHSHQLLKMAWKLSI